MASNGNLIEIEDLTKIFYTDEVETHALSGIHLTMRAVSMWRCRGLRVAANRGNGYLFALRGQRDHGDHRIHQQITAERNHVPEHHRLQLGMKHDVENPRRLAQVDEDEKHAHRDRRDRQKFAEESEADKLLIVVQVIGQNHYDRGSGDAHKKVNCAI